MWVMRCIGYSLVHYLIHWVDFLQRCLLVFKFEKTWYITKQIFKVIIYLLCEIKSMLMDKRSIQRIKQIGQTTIKLLKMILNRQHIKIQIRLIDIYLLGQKHLMIWYYFNGLFFELLVLWVSKHFTPWRDKVIIPLKQYPGWFWFFSKVFFCEI